MTFNQIDFYNSFLKKEKITKEKLSYKKYNSIVFDLFEEIMKAILAGKLNYSLGSLITLGVYRSARNFERLAVNWGESNKIKKKLIEQGLEPAKKIGTNEKGNPIYNNSNHWLVFFTDEFYPVLNVFRHKYKIEGRKSRDGKLYNVPNLFYWDFKVSRSTEHLLAPTVREVGIMKYPLSIYSKNTLV